VWPVTARAVAISALVCAILVVVGRYLLDLSWDSALVLAPVFVLVVGAIAFLIVLWAKVIRDSMRGQGADQ
jgi:ATP/ADP translocase